MSSNSINKSIDDEILIMRAKSGDGTALTMLIEKYSDIILQKANSFKNLNGLDNDDLYQEGMLGFVSAVYSFDTSRGVKFNTYFSTVVIRRMITALRKMNNEAKDPLYSYISLDEQGAFQSQNPTPEEIMIFSEEINEIISFAEKNLSKTERKVFKLSLLGISYSEIAEIIDCDIKSVDNAMQRIRRKIRAINNKM